MSYAMIVVYDYNEEMNVAYERTIDTVITRIKLRVPDYSYGCMLIVNLGL